MEAKTISELSDLVPNLDGYIQPREVAEQRAKFKQLAKDFANLANYCEAKENAMCARQYGKIETALVFERTCEHVYSKLPGWAKW